MKDDQFSNTLWDNVPRYMLSADYNTPRHQQHQAMAYVMGGRAFVANVVRFYIWTWSL